MTIDNTEYKPEQLSHDRRQWYNGFERGLQEGLNIIMELEGSEIEDSTETPAYAEAMEQTLQAATDWYLHYMEEKKNEVLVALVDEQANGENWDVKTFG